jgi:hypothetical protein
MAENEEGTGGSGHIGWSVPEASLSEQGEETKTALTQGSDVLAPSAHLTEQGEAAKADLTVGQDNPWPTHSPRLSPGAQATLKALRGH